MTEQHYNKQSDMVAAVVVRALVGVGKKDVLVDEKCQIIRVTPWRGGDRPACPRFKLLITHKGGPSEKPHYLFVGN